MFEKGTLLESSLNGEVRYAFTDSNLLIQKMISNLNTQTLIRKDIDVKKFLCGKDTILAYDELFQCESDLVPNFRGCVQDAYDIYILQDRTIGRLKDLHVLTKYRLLTGLNKAKAMIKLINKFQRIHDMRIVHSDIKPESILVVDADFNDLRITDFWHSDIEGEFNNDLSSEYCDPFRTSYLYSNFGSDIYSLAITFAVLEADGEKAVKLFKEKCPLKDFSDRCKEMLQSALKAAFNDSTHTKFLLNVMTNATSFEGRKRFQRMKDFAEAILVESLKLMNDEAKKKFISEVSMDPNINLVKKEPTKVVLSNNNDTSKDNRFASIDYKSKNINKI